MQGSQLVNRYHPDTICALATPPGKGGVGIVRVSGPKSAEIAAKVTGITPKPRYAHYTPFSLDGHVIDEGIALFFPAPHSFTGEDVLELHGHGGPVVLDLLLAEILKLGGRMARPGEFSERAFLNDKLDLTQAEAIADLIDAESQQAAKQALNSLQGGFSRRIDQLVDQITHLRMYVESAIDFPEEEIDFLSDGKVKQLLELTIQSCDATLKSAEQGVLMREGISIVIAGRPNAGKSSLLNQLAEKDLAIVTDIAGTTRDVLREHIHIDGLPLHIIDTAGLRDSPDTVERIGIERAWKEIDHADRILLIIDATDPEQLDFEKHWPEFIAHANYQNKLTIIFNKIDKNRANVQRNNDKYPILKLSALTGKGLDELKSHLKSIVGFEGSTEGGFSARRRHLEALRKAKTSLASAQTQLQFSAGELLAEDLKAAQNNLCEVTGAFTPDDLLGKIFTSFCIGK